MSSKSLYPPVTGAIGPRGQFGDQEYLYFAGNNYLALAGRPELREGAISTAKEYGTSFGAGRTTTGTSDLHLKLERELARFKVKEEAIIFASGYLGNQIILSGLVTEKDAVVYDNWVHPSVLEGIPRSAKDPLSYEHNHISHLQEVTNELSQGVIIINGVDPITGEIAPLDEIMEVIEDREFRVLVDDAHGTGVLGENGRGTPEHFGITSNRVYQTETMSKALGSFGGFITCDKDFADRLRKTAATYIGSTPLPPAVIGASLAAVKIVTEEPELRMQVQENADYMYSQLSDLGLDVKWYGAPIISVQTKGSRGEKISQLLLDHRIIVPFIHYPTGDSPGRLRLTVSAEHTRDDIDHLCDILRKNL